MFLTFDELTDLTGYRFAAYQIRWLTANGIQFLLNCEGKPRVLKSVILDKIGGTDTPTTIQPNFAALKTKRKRGRAKT